MFTFNVFIKIPDLPVIEILDHDENPVISLSDSDSDVEEQRAEVPKLKIEPECSICYRENPEFIFKPCMHQCACFECAYAINYGQEIERGARRRCPLCRERNTNLFSDSEDDDDEEEDDDEALL